MTAVTQSDLTSVEDYLAAELTSDVRHEYLGGYVYAMAGARNQHNLIAGTFFALMFIALRGKPCKPFNSDTKVRIRLSTHTRFYYPDGMIVCDQNAVDDSFQDRPVMIAEVVSESTRRIDEGEKREAYLTIPTLDGYVVIDSERPRVVMHSRTDSGFVTRIFEGRDASVPLPTLGIDLPLAELYEQVTFTVPAEQDGATP